MRTLFLSCLFALLSAAAVHGAETVPFIAETGETSPTRYRLAQATPPAGLPGSGQVSPWLENKGGGEETPGAYADVEDARIDDRDLGSVQGGALTNEKMLVTGIVLWDEIKPKRMATQHDATRIMDNLTAQRR